MSTAVALGKCSMMACIFSRLSTNQSPLTVSPLTTFDPSAILMLKAVSTRSLGALKLVGMPMT